MIERGRQYFSTIKDRVNRFIEHKRGSEYRNIKVWSGDLYDLEDKPMHPAIVASEILMQKVYQVRIVEFPTREIVSFENYLSTESYNGLAGSARDIELRCPTLKTVIHLSAFTDDQRSQNIFSRVMRRPEFWALSSYLQYPKDILRIIENCNWDEQTKNKLIVSSYFRDAELTRRKHATFEPIVRRKITQLSAIDLRKAQLLSNALLRSQDLVQEKISRARYVQEQFQDISPFTQEDIKELVNNLISSVE